MVANLGMACATPLELAGTWNLRSGKTIVLSGFWAEGIVRVDAWEGDH